MPFLSDKGIALLGSFTPASLQAASGVETLYTTPAGKVTRITHIVVRDPTGSLAGGTSFVVTGFRGGAGFDLSSMTTTGTDYMVVDQNNLKSTEIAASTAVQITKSTGATAAVTATIDVFGYTT